jgi:hypothetical protein
VGGAELDSSESDSSEYADAAGEVDSAKMDAAGEL